MTWVKGQSGNPHGRVANVERLFLEQLNIVAQEEVEIEVDANGKDLPPQPGQGRMSKAARKRKLKDKQRRFRTIKKLRRIAEVAFQKAMDGSLEHMEFVVDRMDGKPTATQYIAVERRGANLDVRLTYEEARDKLLEMGLDVEKMPLLGDMKRSERQ
jgi:hypothetical protein